MSKTFKISILPILLFLFFTSSNEILATHIVGGELTYKCLGDNYYEVKLVVRRDCENGAEDAPFDDPAIIGVFDIFGALQIAIGNLGTIQVPLMNEDTVSNELLFDCGAIGGAIGGAVCVHETTYIDTIRLPWNKIGYILSYQRCCRNGILNNIVDPLETGATYYARIEAAALKDCNSQPRFIDWPDVYICVDEDLEFDHSAVDIDGDSLVYSLCTPLQGASLDSPKPSPPENPPYSTVSWLSPFNLSNMMGGDAIRINSRTGEITAKPDIVGTYLIGVCVDEYRNGILLSRVQRDFEYNVRVCVDPILSDFEILENDCDGDTQVSFNNTTEGADEYLWYFDYPNTDPAFTSTSESPSFIYPAMGSYTVRLEATRSSDGCTTVLEKTIVISDIPLDPDFEAVFESCDGGNIVQLNDLSTDPSGISSAVNWEWTVLDNNGSTINLSGNPASFDALGLDSIDITMVVTSNAGCVSSITKPFDLTDLFPNADFSIALVGCSPNGYNLDLILLSSTSLEVESISWDVNDNGNISTLSGDSINITSETGELSVTMTVDYENGCQLIVSKDITPSDFLPELIINHDLLDPCVEEFPIDVTFTGELIGGNMIGNPMTYTWVANDSIMSSGESITLTIIESGVDSVDLEVIYDNGCLFSASDELETLDAADIQISESVDCDEPVIITLEDLSDHPSLVSEIWIINGVESSDSILIIELTEDLNIIRIVELDNGCISEEAINYLMSDFEIDLDIGNDFCDTCPEDPMDVNFFPIISGPASFGTPTFNWTYDDGNGSMSFTGDTLTLLLESDQLVELSLTVSYDNGCEKTVEEDFRGSECIIDPLIQILVNCDDPSMVSVTLVDTTVLDPGVTIVDHEWIVNGVSSEGNEVSFIITEDTINVSLNIEYSDGCITEYSQSFASEDYVPIINYDVELLECSFGIGTFLFTNNSSIPDNCLEVESLSWIINGQMYTGDSVLVDIPLGDVVDVEFIITFTNGTSISTGDDNNPNNDSINTNDYIDNEDFSIMQNSIGFCGDTIDLSIIDPDATLIYNWSYDGEFSTIIGTGISIITETNDSYTGVVYAQAISDSLCIYGESSIEIEDNSIDISFNMPYIICAGDTANFDVINNDTSQILTYLWKEAGPELIEGGDTNSPLIGIGEDHTEDFFYILCTENQYGCTSSDTINFMINENEDLEPFTFDLDSCGGLTINFQANNSFSGIPNWDFGDGNSSGEINPSHTYGSSGTYIVTLSDSSDVCPKNPISDTITILDFIEISINPDTIEYTTGETVIVTAMTNGNPDTIEWCNEEGENIFTGNPLEHMPQDSIEKVYAKITDSFGCSDTTCVVFKLKDDCPEDLSIEGPTAVCVGDTFQLQLIMDKDPADFVFTWDPQECIVSGGDTDNPTVTIDEDKTFSVLIQREGICEDTIISYTVNVSSPVVSIITNTGDPFVCLGEDITLMVEPEDPNCTYTWSTGQLGSEITVSPELDIVYTVTCVDSLGCEASADFNLEVRQPQCDENDVYLPNAFSPNGDNVNDILFVRSKFVESMDFYIVDRWGEEVFRSNDQRNGWDGTYKGESLAPDVYAYCLKVTCINGSEYVTVGNVSIIK